MPYYLGHWPICNQETGVLCGLQVSKLLGDMLKFFVVGVLVICVQGHRVDGVTLWASMVFLMIMMGYLREMICVRYKMVGYAVFDTPYQHLYLFRSLVFVFPFLLVLIMVFVVSHETYQRKINRPLIQAETFSDVGSDDEILGDYQKIHIFSATFLWWNSVNGFKNMHDYYTPLKLIMVGLCLFKI